MAEKMKAIVKDNEMLPFCMADAQEVVNVYRASGRYIEALRLLQCMKEKAQYDCDTLSNPSVYIGDVALTIYINDEFIPCLNRQMEQIRALLRMGI